MAKNITLMGADYPDVPAVQLPKTGGGVATFYDIDEFFTKESAGSTLYGTLSAKKATAGNVVVVTGYLNANSNASANTVIITGLPTVDGPNYTPITVWDNTGAGKVDWLLLSDGSIQCVTQLASNHSYRFSFAYIH